MLALWEDRSAYSDATISLLEYPRNAGNEAGSTIDEDAKDAALGLDNGGSGTYTQGGIVDNGTSVEHHTLFDLGYFTGSAPPSGSAQPSGSSTTLIIDTPTGKHYGADLKHDVAGTWTISAFDGGQVDEEIIQTGRELRIVDGAYDEIRTISSIASNGNTDTLDITLNSSIDHTQISADASIYYSMDLHP